MPTKTRVVKPFGMQYSQQQSIAGIDIVTVAQHLALNDGTLDTHPKIMDAVRSLVGANRGWNVSTVGDPMDVDAMTKGKGKARKKKGKGSKE